MLTMAAVRRFEDLRVWLKARGLADAIDARCSEPPLSRHFVLADQMRRAALSVMSNIAEGFDLGSPRQFRHFLRIAKASAAELRSQLYLCSDRGYLDLALAARLQEETREIGRMLMALIRHLDRCVADGTR
jgi:four helix bundle protein